MSTACGKASLLPGTWASCCRHHWGVIALAVAPGAVSLGPALSARFLRAH